MFTCEQNVNRIILKTVTFLLLLMRNNVAFALPAVFIMEAKCHKVHDSSVPIQCLIMLGD